MERHVFAYIYFGERIRDAPSARPEEALRRWIVDAAGRELGDPIRETGQLEHRGCDGLVRPIEADRDVEAGLLETVCEFSRQA
jgi:hypothetical protein